MSDRLQQSLTHLDESGAARMVDVGTKPATAREAEDAASQLATHGASVPGLQD